jgi:hypothetical protein
LYFSRLKCCNAKNSFLKNKKHVNQAKDEMNVVFYNNKLLVNLFKNGELQLMRSFEYETSEDVAYYLLNICEQFNVDCEKLILTISGLIDDHSTMFAELEKYFLLIQLNQRPADFKYSPAFDEYPPHFFTSIFNAALCE